MLKILEVIREINDVDELVEKGEILQNAKKYSEAMICFDKYDTLITTSLKPAADNLLKCQSNKHLPLTFNKGLGQV